MNLGSILKNTADKYPDRTALIHLDSRWTYVELNHRVNRLAHSLLNRGDYYFLLADYRDYVATQEKVGRLFETPDKWARLSILNTARMGKFSSDRSVLEYAGKIWQVVPVELDM